MKTLQSIPSTVYHRYLNEYLLANTQGNKLAMKEAKNFLARTFRIPRQLQYAILKEMEMMGLLIINNRHEVTLINIKKQSHSKTYNDLGCW